MGLREKLPRGRTVAHFENRLWPASVSLQSVLPFDQPCPGRGTIEEETKTGRPTQALKRTAGAVSTGGGRAMGVAVSRLEC